MNKIRAYPPPSSSDGQDGISWKGNPHGSITIKSAYRLLQPPAEIHQIWKQLWKWKGPQRISVFIWLAVHSLLTGLRRSRWPGSSADYPSCNGIFESVLHVLRDCPYANGLWVHLVDPNRLVEFFSLDHNAWFETCLSQDLGCSSELKWEDVFRVVCWFNCKWRNRVLFEEGFVMPHNRMAIIRHFLSNLSGHIDTLRRDAMRKQNIDVRWACPPSGWVKLNTDGSSKGNPGDGGCGGLIRDEAGQWVASFCCHIGICSAFTAELWGILRGLCLAWAKGFRRVLIESNSNTIVHILTKQVMSDNNNPLLRIHALMG